MGTTISLRVERKRQVALVRVHVVDDLRDAARRRSAADALADRDANVLDRLRPLPRPENEVGALDEVDADPGVVLEAVVKDSDHFAGEPRRPRSRG